MAHLLEHMMFKGSTHHRNVPQELDRARRTFQRHHVVRSHELLRDRSADRREHRLGTGAEADRMVTVHRQKDLESEFTVVRNEFEAGENDPGRVLVERVLSTAYLWHNYGATRSARERHRARADRAAAGVLSSLLSADAARRRRQVRRGEDAGDDRTAVGSVPKPARSLAAGNLLFARYTVEPRRMANARRRCASRAMRPCGDRLTTSPPDRTRTTPRSTCCPDSRRQSVRPTVQGARRHEAGGVHLFVRVPTSRAVDPAGRGPIARRPEHRHRRRGHEMDVRPRGLYAVHRTRRSSAPRPPGSATWSSS